MLQWWCRTDDSRLLMKLWVCAILTCLKNPGILAYNVFLIYIHPHPFINFSCWGLLASLLLCSLRTYMGGMSWELNAGLPKRLEPPKQSAPFNSLFKHPLFQNLIPNCNSVPMHNQHMHKCTIHKCMLHFGVVNRPLLDCQNARKEPVNHQSICGEIL